MRSARTWSARVAGGLCLALLPALSLSACTNAADWKASGGSDAFTGYDVSGIQPQDDIIAMLPEGALSDGVFDVAASTDYAPAEFLDTDGTAIGYDVDLTKAIAAVLGVDSTTHTAEFDSIIAAVGSKYDAGISSFTVTTERESAMDMISYINVGSRFNVASGNPEGVDPSDHLNLCGLTIGVQTGTAQEEAMNADSTACTDAGLPAISVRSYSSQSEATTGLVGHVVDAVYSDSTVAGYAVELTDGGVETIGEVEDALPQGIVLTKDNPEFNAAIQAAVQYLMDEGIWEEILDAWGIQDAALETAELNPNVEQ
ncbi:ABC transporter substrate-binding protein [Actinomyces sp. MRS3W]|uniref:ABC transporter substrate-binding protein n=1 Tax=Actinomyces sp. MRS3W TaxID=2800796 RepID=UPI0028FDB644|nr:ABC transporter substrate-binding protein [Actinomyces sp. MRS3W]MDU0348947.1 ABC transporter substrate-binding protein [Actinomyces sp. MRS3W]